jgi:hypothetical protein
MTGELSHHLGDRLFRQIEALHVIPGRSLLQAAPPIRPLLAGTTILHRIRYHATSPHDRTQPPRPGHAAGDDR